MKASQPSKNGNPLDRRPSAAHLGLCSLQRLRQVVSLCLQHRRRLAQLRGQRLLLLRVPPRSLLRQARGVQQALRPRVRRRLALQRLARLLRRAARAAQLLLDSSCAAASGRRLAARARQRLCELCSVHHGMVVLLLGLARSAVRLRQRRLERRHAGVALRLQARARGAQPLCLCLQLRDAAGAQAVGSACVCCQALVLGLQLLQRAQRPLKLSHHAPHGQLLLSQPGLGALQRRPHVLRLLGRLARAAARLALRRRGC